MSESLFTPAAEEWQPGPDTDGVGVSDRGRVRLRTETGTVPFLRYIMPAKGESDVAWGGQLAGSTARGGRAGICGSQLRPVSGGAEGPSGPM
jgi:hypothetical protein